MMTIRYLKLALPLMGILLLAGCAVGYRDRLHAYQEAGPPPFDRQTIDWIKSSHGAATPTTGTEPAMLAAIAATTSVEDVATSMIAQVTGIHHDSIQSQMERVKDPEFREGLLSGTFDWLDLGLAVAAVNPSVRSARERWQATLQQFSQADFLETLISQYRSFTRYLDVGTGKPLNKSMIQQFFPYPGAISLKGELVRRQVELARIEWEKTLRDALVKAGQIHFAYQYLWRTEATTRENITLIEDVLRVVEQRYRVGIATQADLLKVQTELERQRNLLEDLDARKQATAADLNALLDRIADAPLGRPADGDLPLVSTELEALTSQALAGRQEVTAQQVRVDRTRAAIRLGEVMNRPLASQGYSSFERTMMPEASEAESGMPYGMASKATDRPAYAQAEAFLAEMRQRKQAEQSTLDQLTAETRSMAHSWLKELDIAKREVTLVREIVLPQNRSAYETSLSGYSSDRINFLDLLDAERALINARLELDAARRDLNQTMVRYANVTGRLPNRE